MTRVDGWLASLDAEAAVKLGITSWLRGLQARWRAQRLAERFQLWCDNLTRQEALEVGMLVMVALSVLTLFNRLLREVLGG